MNEKHKVDLLIYYVKENKDYVAMTLEIPNKPYYLASKYEYKNVQGVDLIYVKYDESLNKTEIEPGIKNLINNRRITISDRSKNTHNWYLKFIYCKTNPKNMVAYDKIQFEKALDSILELGIKNINHSYFLYPKCNED